MDLGDRFKSIRARVWIPRMYIKWEAAIFNLSGDGEFLEAHRAASLEYAATTMGANIGDYLLTSILHTYHTYVHYTLTKLLQDTVWVFWKKLKNSLVALPRPAGVCVWRITLPTASTVVFILRWRKHMLSRDNLNFFVFIFFVTYS